MEHKQMRAGKAAEGVVLFLLLASLAAGCTQRAWPGASAEAESRSIPDSPAATSTPAPAATPAVEPEEAETAVPEMAEAQQGRALSDGELAELTASMPPEENGFFLSAYSRPEEIDWYQVCYNGAGISQEPTAAQLKDYERYNEPVTLHVTAIAKERLAAFVAEKTESAYAEARAPLSWHLTEDGVYLHEHDDTNYQPITFTKGYADGDVYQLYYNRMDLEYHMIERPYVMTAVIRDGAWTYRSNVPADAPAPRELLSIHFYETREEVEALGISELVPVEERDSDEPFWHWAVVTAETDGLVCRLERGEPETEAEEAFDQFLGLLTPDELLYSRRMDRGEQIALWVNEAWYPRLRLSAVKDAFYGEYWFGEDNWLHLEETAPRWIIGHDLQGEGRGCQPANETQLRNFLADGAWGYLDPDTGTLTAAVMLTDNDEMVVLTMETAVPLHLNYGRIFAPQEDAPELLIFSHGDDQNGWDLPEWYDAAEFGSFTYSAAQYDGEQCLTLRQADDSDSALFRLFAGADRNAKEIELWRFYGAV